MRFPLQIIQCPFRKKETVAVVVHKISELVLCKDRIFTNITPQVFTLTPFKEVVKSNSPQRKRKAHIAPFYLACL